MKKYVETSFRTFLKYKMNEKVKLKTKDEEDPIEDLNDEDENGDLPDEETEGQPTPSKSIQKLKSGKVDTLVNEYRTLLQEWEKLTKE
jgi:hypothetical protein